VIILVSLPDGLYSDIPNCVKPGVIYNLLTNSPGSIVARLARFWHHSKAGRFKAILDYQLPNWSLGTAMRRRNEWTNASSMRQARTTRDSNDRWELAQPGTA
jgi:hypothetical protein